MRDKLLAGETLSFDNQQWLDEMGRSDSRMAEVWHTADGPNWSIGWKIWFCGKLFYSSKAFYPFTVQLEKLCAHWNLKPIEE